MCTNKPQDKHPAAEASADSVPGCEDFFVLQLLHSGGGSHRHGDYYVVDVKRAFTSPPLDGLLLAGGRGREQRNM